MTRLAELILVWQDGSISHDEIAELKRLLASPEQRAAAANEFLLTGIVLESVRMLNACEEVETSDMATTHVFASSSATGSLSSAGVQPWAKWGGGLLVCVVLVLFGVQLRHWPALKTKNAPFAQFEQTQGTTFVVTQQEKHPAARGQILVPGDGIATEGELSEAVVNMGDAVRLKLSGDTTVFTSLDEAEPFATRLVLEKGELHIEANRSLKRKKTTIQTQRGFVTAQQEETSLYLSESVGVVVVRGEVDYQHKASGKAIRLQAGEYLAIDGHGELYASRMIASSSELWTTFPRTGINTVSPGCALALSADGKLAAVQRIGEGGVRVGSVKENGYDTLRGERCLQFSSNGKWLAVADQHGVILYDLEDRSRQRALIGKDRKARTQCLAFSPDGNTLAVGRVAVKDEAGLELWDVATGTQKHVLRGHMATIHAVAFSPDGKYLMSGGMDRTAIQWDATSAREITRVVVNPAHAVWALTFSLQGDVVALATGPSDFRIRENSELVLWDYANETIERRCVGHGRAVTSVAFSPDGHTLITGSSDATVRFWERATGRQYGLLKGHKAEPGFEAITVALAPDGQKLVTASFDHTVRVWPMNWSRSLQTRHARPSAEFSLAGGLR